MSHQDDLFATQQETFAYFKTKLSVETDCSDVALARKEGTASFVLLHVVGDAEVFAKRHVPGAIHLPHRQITEERMRTWPQDTAFVVYCAGPHCNGADKAAMKLSALGYSAKVMLGGITGWEDEGLEFATTLEA